MMLRSILLAGLLILAMGVDAAESDQLPDLSQWQEAAMPPEKQPAQRMVWYYASNYSSFEWRVFSSGGKAFAHSAREAPVKQPDEIKFVPKTPEFQGGSAFIAVDEGWLIGFDKGEFGGALYWFSRDGKRRYKISDHQIVDFVLRPDGIYAIEGWTHMGMSVGSVIRVARATARSRWKATTVTKLPSAPTSLSLRKDGTMLIPLSGALVSISPDNTVHTLLPNALWSGLYPNSSMISPDETKLYIGMRQYVGEFNLTTNKFRFLIPSAKFLNKLPKETEDGIRKQYGG